MQAFIRDICQYVIEPKSHILAHIYFEPHFHCLTCPEAGKYIDNYLLNTANVISDVESYKQNLSIACILA